MPWGLSTSGLKIKRLDDVRKDLLQRFQSAFGPNIRSDEKSIFGILTGVVARPIADVWEALQGVYDAFNPSAATGAALDNLAALVGVYRIAGAKATVSLDLTGDPTTLIQAGKMVRSNKGNEYVLLADVTLDGQGEGVGLFESDLEGYRFEPANTITGIVTPVSGWDTVDNANDLAGGTDPETDAELRLRRDRSLAIVGASTDQAIRARVEQLEAVAEASVISNRTMGIVNGVPPKAFEAVIWSSSGGPLSPTDEAEVASTIWEVIPAGIQAYGTELYNVTDESGHLQEVGFSYAQQVPIFIDISITVTPDYPDANNDDLLRLALSELGNKNARMGEPIYTSDFVCAALQVTGVRAASVTISTSSSASEPTVLTIGPRDFPTFDSNDITVTSTPL